jgi:hypothetical protein
MRGPLFVVVVAMIAAGAPAHAERSAPPRRAWIWEAPARTAQAAVNSHVIYLNRCTPGRCVVAQGTTDATADPARSSLGHGVLGAFSQGDAAWATVVACLKEVYAPFQVEVTEVDPGAAPHFEIMFGGKPTELGLAAGIGGVSPFSCAPYVPNSLVFVFDVWGNAPEELCATAAQELAHSFALDHAIEPSDPMTYFPYTGRRHFKNASIQCGSDCDANHRSPLGAPCTGPDQQSHACACGNGAQTQNDVQVISALFGGGVAPPPVVAIDAPRVGAQVAPGFAIHAEITGDAPIASAELRVDGALVAQTTAAPYAFVGPAALADGTHTVEVTGIDAMGSVGRARVAVIAGKGCAAASECPRAGDVCICGRCAAGPGTAGGLGEACAVASDCASYVCATADGATVCAEACQAGQCPTGFGCRADGRGGGVCWPGVDDRSGGCAAGGAPGAWLGLAALVAWRRRFVVRSDRRGRARLR